MLLIGRLNIQPLNNMNIATPRSTLRKTALIALGFALSLAPVTLLNAASSNVLQPLTEQTLKSLPLTPTIAKVAGEEGPFELKLTNSSKASVKVSVQILLSVYMHATGKARNLPAQAIEAGKDLTITKLAALDKVIVSAEGYASLTIEIK